jgi:hypothetical protein
MTTWHGSRCRQDGLVPDRSQERPRMQANAFAIVQSDTCLAQGFQRIVSQYLWICGWMIPQSRCPHSRSYLQSVTVDQGHRAPSARGALDSVNAARTSARSRMPRDHRGGSRGSARSGGDGLQRRRVLRGLPAEFGSQQYDRLVRDCSSTQRNTLGECPHTLQLHYLHHWTRFDLKTNPFQVDAHVQEVSVLGIAQRPFLEIRLLRGSGNWLAIIRHPVPDPF